MILIYGLIIFQDLVYDVRLSEDELPLLYISNYTESTHYMNIYTGREMTVDAFTKRN